jgi:PIN domain nuclease of toxin-antitoxin system
VTLLDAYAVLALALDEEAASEIEEIVRSGSVAVPATNYFEATDRLVRRSGWSPNETSERFGLLFDALVDVLPVNAATAWRGALLRARYYHRTACAVSLADCVLLASAGPDDNIATADPAVAAVARAEGIGLIPLPDSFGQRP